MVFEIQQNSDTTYRVFDWNRLGLDGQPRELHVESSMNSIDFSDVAPGLVQSPWTTEGSLGRRSLVSHSAFAIDEVRIAEGGSVPDTRPQNAFSVLAVIQGGLQLEGGGESVPVFPGGFVLLPGCLSPVMIEAERGTTLLRVLPSNPESSG